MADGGDYKVELDRWGIKNNGTEALNTSKGINDALKFASDQGYTEAILPKGLYLIDENTPIEPQSYMTLNLNGSTLKIQSNGLVGYAIIMFQRNQQFSRVTNGIIQGDKDTHDYTTIKSTHEGGHGIYVDNTPVIGSNIRFLTLDNLEILNCTGDGISLGSLYGQIAGYTFDGKFESGRISLTDGSLQPDNNRIRSSVKIDLSQANILKWGYFGLYGDSYGGLGAGITSDLYDVIFYNKDDTFYSAKANVQFYDEVEVPKGPSYAKIVIHQGAVPAAGQTSITLKVVEFAKNVYIEKCHIHDCRRLGISVNGAKYVYIRGNEIDHIQGTAPQGAIDIEDMYDFNQYIYIENNNLHDNKSYNIIAVAGRHINITNNAINGGTLAINISADKVIMEGNDLRDVGAQLAGQINFSNNHLYGTKLVLSAGDRDILINGCLFHNSVLNINRDKAYSVGINNCKFSNDKDFFSSYAGLGATLSFSIEPQTFSDCVIEGSGVMGSALTWVANETKNGWILNNITFTNTKHDQNIITCLPPGRYSGCRFSNPGPLSIVSNPQAEYVFDGCGFDWDTYTLFTTTSGKKVAMLQVSNSTFAGKQNPAFNLADIGGEMIVAQNIFNYTTATANGAMIDFAWETFISERIILDGNRFKSDVAMKAINAGDSRASQTPIIFKNNVVQTAVVNIVENPKHLQFNNVINGILDSKDDSFNGTIDDIIPPLAVTNLKVGNVTSSAITVTWIHSISSDTAKYEVAYSADGTNYTIASDSVVGTSYNLTGLNASRLYVIRITAIDISNNRSIDNPTVQVLTSAASNAPSPVTNLKVGTLTSVSINVSWIPSASANVIMTEIAYSSDGTNYAVAGLIDKAVSSYTISGLIAGKTYTVRAVSLDVSINRSIAATISATTASLGTPDTIAPVVKAYPESMTFALNQTVFVNLIANKAATIYYTLNGATPTIVSSVYLSPIPLTATTTLKYFAMDTSLNASIVKTSTYSKMTFAIPNSTTLTSGLLHSYDFSQDTGSTQTDLAGAMPLVLNGYNTDGTEGRQGAGLKSTGTGYANNPDITNLGISIGSSFTVVVMGAINVGTFSTNMFSSNKNNASIEIGTPPASIVGRFVIGTYNVGALHVHPQVVVADSTNGNTVIVRDDAATADSSIVNGKVYVIQLTYDATSKQVSLFLNGSLNKMKVVNNHLKFDGLTLSNSNTTVCALLLYNRILTSAELVQVSKELLT
ncbi:fibronectin type III domain-containing protein [Paenibacillus sp. HWE-109]|uniref:fibronectin type III domain-containing protein n=1 Tax=Paenibacillus sp. HWE-109 TaxID=1306526 RepID=UPI001EDD2E07|nr:fibronectin type III domain-containing protein [Paenibacillus sp. HWE-109]UKS24915.1 fibronectin type III domain-containing protein [Paenibacillus sp. HWE-109]